MAIVSSTGAWGRAVAGLALLVTAASCSDAPERSIGRYCAEVNANVQTLNAPAIHNTADVDATLELYRSIGNRAPADVAPEWQVMIDSLETAATLEPGDAAGMVTVNDAALASQAAATRIQTYTRANCGADIGTPPAPTNPVTLTTVNPPTTVSGFRRASG